MQRLTLAWHRLVGGALDCKGTECVSWAVSTHASIHAALDCGRNQLLQAPTLTLQRWRAVTWDCINLLSPRTAFARIFYHGNRNETRTNILSVAGLSVIPLASLLSSCLRGFDFLSDSSMVYLVLLFSLPQCTLKTYFYLCGHGGKHPLPPPYPPTPLFYCCLRFYFHCFISPTVHCQSHFKGWLSFIFENDQKRYSVSHHNLTLSTVLQSCLCFQISPGTVTVPLPREPPLLSGKVCGCWIVSGFIKSFHPCFRNLIIHI